MDQLEPRPDDGLSGSPEVAPGTVVTVPPDVSPAAARSSRRRWVVAGAVTALVAAATVAAALILGAKPLPEAYRYLPAERAAVVLELRLDLPGDQRQQLGNFLAHFPGFADQSTLTTKIDDTLEGLIDTVSNGTVDFATGIRPLLAGPTVAAFAPDALSTMGTDANSHVGGLVVATTDGSLTCDMVIGSSIARETHRGVAIQTLQDDVVCAVDGPFLLFGGIADVRAGIDAHLDHTGIDTNEVFKAARNGLSGDQLALVYVDGKKLAEMIRSRVPWLGTVQALAFDLPDWLIVGFRAAGDALQMEVHSPPRPEAQLGASVPTGPPPSSSQFGELLPADALGFVEAHGVGVHLQRVLARLEIDPEQAAVVAQIEGLLAAVGGVENATGWIADVGVAAIPSADDAGVILLLSGPDPETVANRLIQLHNLLVLASIGTDVTVVDTEHDGVTISKVDLGDLKALLSGLGLDPGILGSGALDSVPRVSFSLAARGNVLMVGIGDGVVERVLDTTASSSLASTPAYKRALELVGSPNDLEAYVAIDNALAWAETGMSLDGGAMGSIQDLKPYLAHLAAFGGATTSNSTGGRSRFVITVK